MNRSCGACGKLLKSLSGFQRHLSRCRVQSGQSNRIIPRAQLDPESPSISSVDATALADSPDSAIRISTTYQWFPEGDNLNLEEFPEIEEPHESVIDGDQQAGNIPSEKTDVSVTSDEEDDDIESDTEGRSHKRGLMSTSSSIRVELYKQITGSGAGVPSADISTIGPSTDNIQKEFYHPFETISDYAFGIWLRSSGVSKGDVDRLLRDSRCAPITQSLSFQTSSQWHTRIEGLPNGMKPDWRTSILSVEAQFDGTEDREYVVHYQNVLEAIRFLIGHRPFANNLSYEPVRHYNTEGQRIYSEMNTAEWWWEKQQQLPEGATVIPLIIATDKTLLTQHHGDVLAWPVYLTIGNLDRRTRRSQTRPAQVLLGFLPVLPASGGGVKAKVWHMAMGLILQPIEEAAAQGLAIRCADEHTRMCYPIIAGFSVDYEEQVLITGVKSGQHCTICTVASDQREDLELQSSPRTHVYTQNQIRKQKKDNTPKNDSDWVHPVPNFAWKHHLVNIHETMMLDPLHQLLKGVLGHLKQWILLELEVTVRKERSKQGMRTNILKANATAQLDERFRRVQRCQKLNIFTCFSDVSQWTGVEEKALLRQFIPVIAPLLVPQAPDVMCLTRAIIEFIILAQYVSHDDDTLRYMRHALFRINKFKGSVSRHRTGGHFNFPKWHVMTHYIDWIRRYGAADNFDTEHAEALHKILVKAHYNLTNKREGFLEQLIRHSQRRLSAITTADIELHLSTNPSTLTNQQTAAAVTAPTRAIELKLIEGLPLAREERSMRGKGLDTKLWCTASSLADKLDFTDFLEALAVFVRHMRENLDGTAPSTRAGDWIERDLSSVKDMPVCIHGALRCWSPTGKISSDLEQLDLHYVRCRPKWQNGPRWRRDWVWVQETPGTEISTDVLNGRLPGQLKIIISVQDQERVIPGTRKFRRYTGAFIEVLRLRHAGQVNEIHGMIEVERWPKSRAKDRRYLGNTRFYTMSTILRCVHLIPVSLQGDDIFYINNYFDWDSFNSLYDPQFEVKGTRAALQFLSRKRKRDQKIH